MVGSNNHGIVDSYDLLVLEFLGSFCGVTGLIMLSVKLKPNICFPIAHSAFCIAAAAISHWALVNTYVFIQSLAVIFLTGQQKMNVRILGFVARRLE
jgi:hypothetical protein